MWKKIVTDFILNLKSKFYKWWLAKLDVQTTANGCVKAYTAASLMFSMGGVLGGQMHAHMLREKTPPSTKYPILLVMVIY